MLNRNGVLYLQTLEDTARSKSQMVLLMDRKLERATAFYKEMRSNDPDNKAEGPVIEAKNQQPRSALFFCELEGSIIFPIEALGFVGADKLAQEYCCWFFWYQMARSLFRLRLRQRMQKQPYNLALWRARPAYWRLFQVVRTFSLLLLAEGAASCCFWEPLSTWASSTSHGAGSFLPFASVRLALLWGVLNGCGVGFIW